MGLFAFNIASVMSDSLTLFRFKFNSRSVISSSTCWLKRVSLRCSAGLVVDCTSIRINHWVPQDEIICINLQSSHFPRFLLSGLGITFFLQDMQPMKLLICRNPIIFPLIVDATMLANSAFTYINGRVNGDVSVN